MQCLACRRVALDTFVGFLSRSLALRSSAAPFAGRRQFHSRSKVRLPRVKETGTAPIRTPNPGQLDSARLAKTLIKQRNPGTRNSGAGRTSSRTFGGKIQREASGTQEKKPRDPEKRAARREKRAKLYAGHGAHASPSERSIEAGLQKEFGQAGTRNDRTNSTTKHGTSKITDSRLTRSKTAEHKSNSRPREAPEQWQIQKAALQNKFGGEAWNPRKKLSPDAVQGIKAMHAQSPEKFTTPVLAEQFKVSPEAIRRILRSKWQPTPERAESRREDWEKRGQKIWENMAELGIRPPKKWRDLGAGKARPGEPPKWKRTAYREVKKEQFERRAVASRVPVIAERKTLESFADRVL